MDKDSKFTRDEDGYVAVRTVSAPYSSGSDDKDSMFTRDEDGYVAVRTISGSGGGSGGDQHNLGWYATESALTTAHPTAEAGDWAIVGATDTVWVWDTDNSQWVDSDQKGQVTSVNNQTGDVTITGADILPTQTGNAGKFLVTNGTSAGWGDSIFDQLNIKQSASSSRVAQLITGNGNNAFGIYVYPVSTTNSYSGQIQYTSQYGRWSIYTKSLEGTNTITIAANSVYSSRNDVTLGKSSNLWGSVYTTKINNGSDITVPAVGGTLALQIATLPTADSTYEGTIYQFTGTTDSTYTNGHFYKCVSDGQTPATYSWTEVSLGGSSYTAGTGIDITSGVISVTAPTLKNTATGTNAFTVLGTVSTDVQAFNIGISSQAYTYSTAIGYNSTAKSASSVAVGNSSRADGVHSIAIGYDARISSNSAAGTIVIGRAICQSSNTIALSATDGSGLATLNDANSMYISIQSGVWTKLVQSDGTIPTDRFTTTPSADGTYVPTLTISSGVATRSWSAPSGGGSTSTTVTLAVNDWSSNTQTVSCQGVTSSNIIIVAPAPSSNSAYVNAGILCTAQGTNSLTFTATTTPTSAITVNIAILS